MNKVLDITQKQYDILSKSSNVKDVVFELNDGGHFNDVEGRLVRGISWILKE